MGASRKRQRVVSIVLSFVAVLILSLFLVTAQLFSVDPYSFLQGRRPVARGVLPILAHSPLNGFSHYEYRAYSWEADFHAIHAEAGKELARKGFLPDSFANPPNLVFFSRADGVAVQISDARTRPGWQLFDPEDKTAGWITAIVFIPMPDTKLTRLRYELHRALSGRRS